nr:MAG: RNA dependent RNA polymerase [Mitoviridae sp.]
MNSKRSLISGLTLRLLVIGIPKHTINPFAELILRWVTCSGEEWTVKRLKDLKQTVIHLHSGLLPTIPLARNRKGAIKGVVGYLMRWAGKKDDNFVKVINSFMAYSHWTSSILTASQRKKFLEAVNATPQVIPEHLKNLIRRSTRQVTQLRTVKRVPSPLITWRGSPSKRAPTLHGSKRQSEHLLHECELVRNEETWQHIHSLWEPVYRHVFKGIDIRSLVDGYHYDCITNTPLVAGEVHFLQEPGYKLRSIASPYRLFQVASKPLQEDLKELLTGIPWDCTHAQDRAFEPIRKAINQGRLIYSVDLSSATDYFPFELQEIVLQTIYGRESPYVKLFRDVSRATWHSELGDICWKKGQPLGFNPSFFIFTLTHGLLLHALNGGKWNHDFYVVGDDVVILSRTLYDDYIKTLSLLGCPYSPTKSIVSSKLAEFAGKVITSDLVIPQLKWHGLSDDNFIDIARLIGPRVRKLLTKRQNAVLDVFAHIPDFIHPYGLNWSYPGSNLEKMVKSGLELTFEQSVLSSLTGLSESVHRQLYADYGPITMDLLDLIQKDVVKNEIQTFDEKVVSVFTKLGFARKFYEYFLEGLRDLPEVQFEMGMLPSRMLPPETVQPSRVTLLQRLVRFLKKPKPRVLN